MIIIIDHKHKKANSDNQWVDPLGVEQAKRLKAHTLEVDPNSKNVVDRFICDNGAKALKGKKAYCMDDQDRMFEGWIMDCYVSRMLLIKIDGKNRPFEFSAIIAIGE